MTKPRKKPKRTKLTRSQEGTATKAKKKQPKQTAHRRVASDPEVHELLERLRKRWKRTSGKERRDRVAQLLSKGCKLRGIADDIHQPESVVRYYSKPAPDSPAKEKPEAHQRSVPAKSDSKRMTAPPAQVKLKPVSSNDRSEGVHQQPGPSGRHPLAILTQRQQELREKVLFGDEYPEDDDNSEVEESLASLRLRLPELIVEFIRAKLGSPDTPARSAQIRELLNSVRYHSQLQPPLIYPRHLPNAVTVSQLYELTGVEIRRDRLDGTELGRWVAVILHSLAPRAQIHLRTSPWEQEIEQAERQLFPRPEQVSTPAPASGRQPLRVSAAFTTTGFADRNRWRVPRRT